MLAARSNSTYGSPTSVVYADSDLDWDGLDDWNSGGADGDLFTESYNANTGLSGSGRVSSPGVASRTGYAGYQWDQTLSAYHVRYRVYLPDIGRWTRRDPLGYVDGMGLYEYCGGAPLGRVDSRGLASLCEAFGCRVSQWCGPLDCVQAWRASERAQQEVELYFSGHACLDDQCDAFRHCVWSCYMTRSVGERCAAEVGNIHERCRPSGAKSEYMDEENNLAGRAVASKPGECVTLCFAALFDGTLRSHLVPVPPGWTPPRPRMPEKPELCPEPRRPPF